MVTFGSGGWSLGSFRCREFRWCLFPEARLESRYAGSEMVLGFVPACVVVSGGCDRQSSMASRWSPEAPLHFRSIPNGTLSRCGVDINPVSCSFRGGNGDGHLLVRVSLIFMLVLDFMDGNGNEVRRVHRELVTPEMTWEFPATSVTR
ncbi:Uncharacterized protein Rs2_45898 [Raphanus sativus]|nr:Uncharacterized protein Rs2_45898 [Raphanus sativus]